MRRTFLKLNTRFVALVMAVMLALCAVPAVSAAETSGSCGGSLTWTFADGKLTISGSGDMTDYSEWNLPPWYSFREEILWLSLPEGLTSVGDMAFYDCINLTALAIPSTVTEIGELAFCQNRGMTVLSLNTGLKIIGRSAFERCESLQDLRLPDTLTTIGENAFYFCKSLTYVTVPASVTQMGSGVFAYCDSLVRADIRARLNTLPSWTFYGCASLNSVSLPDQMTDTESYAFYGCDRLNTVNFGGDAVDADALKQKIDEDVPTFGHFGDVSGGDGGNSGHTFNTNVNDDGGYSVSNITVTKTEDATVDITIEITTDPEGNTVTTVEITATVVDPDGWDDVLTKIDEGENEHNDAEPMEVTVYVNGGTEVPQEVLDILSGRNVVLTVQTQDGSKFTVDFTTLNGREINDNVGLSYTISVLETPPEELAGVLVYQLCFDSSSEINTEVLIRIPGNYARETASLYQLQQDELTFLQSVIVDDEGYAHFYLASVDHKTEYLIGINVPNEESRNAIVPGVLQSDYGVTYTSDGVEYVVTGRTSSWNMDINQVTWIMVGVLVIVVVVVGVVMFMLNKRKLKRGYVPQLDEEDYNL